MTFNLACRGTGLRPANYEKMLANGFGRAYNLARQGRPSCWLPNESGASQIPSVNALRSREKRSMPSRPNACSSDTATATIAFAANLQF